MKNIIKRYATDTNVIPENAIGFIDVDEGYNIITRQKININEWIIEDDSKHFSKAYYYRYIDVFDSDTLMDHIYYYREPFTYTINGAAYYRYHRNK